MTSLIQNLIVMLQKNKKEESLLNEFDKILQIFKKIVQDEDADELNPANLLIDIIYTILKKN